MIVILNEFMKMILKEKNINLMKNLIFLLIKKDVRKNKEK